MAKNKPDDFDYDMSEEQLEEVEHHVSEIVLAQSNDVTKFAQYSNIFDHPRIKDIIPDFYTGEALAGHVIAIHKYEWQESYAHKVSFIRAEIEIAGYDGLAQAGFFSVPAKTFFKGLDSVGVKLPIVVGIKAQKNTYIFCNPNELLQR